MAIFMTHGNFLKNNLVHPVTLVSTTDGIVVIIHTEKSMGEGLNLKTAWLKISFILKKNGPGGNLVPMS